MQLKFYSFFIFVISFFTTILDSSFVYAVNEVKELETVHQYKRCGDYVKALEIARNIKENSNAVSEIIVCLEKDLLTLGSSMILFDENHKPRDKLLQILSLVGMQSFDESSITISEINAWAQKNLLRKGERWEEQTTHFENLKPKLMPLLEDLGFVNDTSSHFKTYQGAIIHGALLSTVRRRIHTLIQEWEQGVRFPHLYFLGGDRPLNPEYENTNTLKSSKTPKTESEMMELVWEQSNVPLEIKNQVDVHFISAPMKIDPKTKQLQRPNTDDTVEMWLKATPPHGRYLAVSNAPYTNRQDLVIRTIAPNDYTFDTIGPAANKQERVIIFLDELARLIFQLHKLSKKE